MAPPPPPPLCFPFSNKKPKRRLSWSSSDSRQPLPPPPAKDQKVVRHPSFSPTSTYTTQADSLTFHSDSEKYDELPSELPVLHKDEKGRSRLNRSNTMTGTKKSTTSSKWGYGWGVGKKDKEKEREREDSMNEKSSSQVDLPLYQPVVRRDSRSTQASRSTQKTQETHRTYASQNSKASGQSQETYRSGGSKSTAPKPRPPLVSGHTLNPQDSTSTLVGSAFERKINDVESIRMKPDTTDRLDEMRRLMAKDNLDYYVVPSEDAHGSEYVAASDKRREFISGFTGSAGQAIITKSSAYLFTDSRYWLQAQEEIDHNWTLIRCGAPGSPADWIEWLEGRVKGSRIGIDARMISHEKATLINTKINGKDSKLVYPPQNLVDLIWVDKPTKSLEMVYIQSTLFAGKDAVYKLEKLREWIRQQPAAVPSYSKSEPLPSQMHTATLVTSLACIAYLLNLRGSDIPYNPLFHGYLFVTLDKAFLFVEPQKLHDDVIAYLDTIGVQRKSYTDLWPFLRRREWGEGKVLIAPQTSYAISLMLTHFRYTVAPSYVEVMMSVKNETEIEGLRRAYLRDGVSFVRFLAWLEYKLAQGYDITEYEAGFRLTEFRRKNKYFMGLAYENISASGPNAALPHYSPRKSTAAMISRDLPYLNDSGAQYYDGTCDTTRTMHFGRPTPEMCEAYTRVLQGHIAIDTAIFPEGTSGRQLDVLARKALWKDGMNYMHGTGHGFGAFLSVHEGPHGFASNVPLVPGHVITNEPGFYLEGKWGMRIESALVVTRVKTRGQFNGDVWLGFDRFTCVPIQTRMVKESMLTKEEKQWIKDHNTRCYDKIAPFLKDDKRALKWLKREAERGIGLAPAAGGISIDWD
ncbi:putative Xaa-Pro aminopeptidase P [Psilocybe cubensis]|uniref:Uncharacterized protein n=2 Tax=Psilocybe cubensis TaxID=181762 RepID=A0A8H7Y6U9_PSICU|nr:putative Xaa-Pro aminopeptidase P [Psilocybe cubensis]KAH9484818.1 putative Xaa-Pro aminopeptidase P [Psilocybe cubensis]